MFASIVSACGRADQPDNAAVLDDIRSGRSGVEVVVKGVVVQVLPTSPERSSYGGYAGRHERFVIALRNGTEQDILVAHNVSIARPVPIQRGDTVIVRGELALDPSGPVIHWTHHDPHFRHSPGFVERNGKMYD